MPSTRELRLRIKSVKSTRQITKAMELVSAAKMRRATEATMASRPYVNRAQDILLDIVSQPIEGLVHPLIAERSVKSTLVFAISSDRTLAGSYNANVSKAALEFLKSHEGQTVHFITMGRQIDRFLNKVKATVVQSYPHTPTQPTSADLVPISNTIAAEFLKGTYDRVVVLYTDFRSSIVQEVTELQLLPLTAPSRQKNHSDEREFSYEPDPLSVLDIILPRLLEAQMYQCLEESLASEHAARRVAMKSASDNAADMIDDLTLTYNGVRQGSITQELAEISGGAAALGA